MYQNSAWDNKNEREICTKSNKSENIGKRKIKA